MNPRRLTISLAACFAAFSPTIVCAGTLWVGGAADNFWGTAGNWSPSGAPPVGATVDLTFDSTVNLTSVNNYTAFDDFHSLTFAATAGAFSLSGSSIDLFGKIENYSTATQTLAMDLAINGGQAGTGEFNPVNGDLVINSANVFTNGNTLHVYGTNNKTVTFGAGTVISQAGHFNVEQASNAIFLGNNTYTGTTNVLAGTLTVGSGGTSGTLGTGTVTVASGAKLTWNRSDAFTVSNVLAGAGSYFKAGSGTLNLGGVNTFTGSLTVSNGTVNAGANTSALGGGSIVLGDANTGANNVAFLTTTAGTSRPITVSASGTGTVTLGSTTGAGAGNVNFGGTLTLNRATTLTAASTDRTTWAGKITGNVGTLTITGGQRTVFDNTANDFTGNIAVTGTNTVLQTGVGTGTEHMPNGASIDIGAGAIVKLAGVAGSVETINALTGTGVMRRHDGVGGVQTLVLGSAGGSGSFGGTLLTGNPGTGTLAIRKEGAGTQTITSVAGNTASAGITVNGGVLKFTGTAGFDAGTFATAQTYTVNSGGTLEINGDWLTKSTSTYTINAGGILAFTKTTGDVTLSYVNNLNLTDATVNGPGNYRTGNNTTATHNFSGNLGSTINSGFGLVKNGAAQTVNMNVADGTADADLTVAGVIYDVSALLGSTLVKQGAGKMIFTASNTYTGPTTISAGTLELGGTAGTLGTGAVTNSAALNFKRSNALTVANLISGTGTLNQTGSGTTTLTGANTYTGATNVTAGTLLTTPAQTGATTITVSDGAAFGVKLAAAGTTFNTPSLTTGTTTGASLVFDTGALGNPTAAVINATSFTPAAATTLRLLGSNLTPATFTLLDYTGSIGGTGFGGLSLALPFRVGGTLVNNTGNTSVDVTISGVETAKWQGNVNGNWDIDPDGGNTAGTFNWKTSLLNTSTRYAQGAVNTDSATFDDTATGTTSVNLTTTLTPTGVTVNNTSLNYTFGGTGKISGTTGLTKQGNGTLVLANTAANDYTGGTTISGGTLQLGDGTTAGAGAVGGAITNNASLVFNRPDDATAANVISGTGTVLKSGAGKITLSAANGYGGGTTIRRGTLTGLTNTSFGSGAITLGDAGTGTDSVALYLGNRADISNNVVVSAQGTGTVTIGADNSGSGANAASLLGTITLNRPTTFSGEVTADRLALDGQISGNVGTLTVTGGSRTTFSSTANNFVGDIVITGVGSILQASVAGAAETIPDGSSITVGAGAVLQLASLSGAETINALNGAGTVRTFLTGTFGSGLAVGSANGSGSFSGSLENGTIGNPLSLTKTGSGTQTLSGASTYTGTTTVNGGTLEISGASGSLANTGAVTVTGGTLLLSGSNPVDRINNAAAVSLGGAAGDSKLVAGGVVTETVGALTLTAGAGVRVIDFGSAGSLLTFASLASSAPGVAVQVWNWTGTVLTGGGADQLISTGILGANIALSDIKFYGDNGSTYLGDAIFAGGGTSGELVPIPEAGSVLTALLLLGAAGWRERKWLIRAR